MAEGVNVRFAGDLQRFIQSRISQSGLYSSASEYIRDLVCRDYEREEQRKWMSLQEELAPGIAAEESAFVPLDIEKVITTARHRRKNRG